MKEITAKISTRNEVAKDTYEISFQINKGSFDFIAGQYVEVMIPKLLYPDIKGAIRNFSISSSPNNHDSFTIVFRASESGFKRTLLKLPIGSEVVIRGPLGVFKLLEDIQKNVVFLAGGIGVSPFMSMIRFAMEKHIDISMTLLYANSKLERATYVHELEVCAEQNKNFQLHTTYGRIDIPFLRENITGEFTEKKWYIAGPPAFVHSAYYLLRELEIKEENIVIEEMSGYDGGVHRFDEVTLAKRDMTQKNTDDFLLEDSDMLSTTVIDVFSRSALLATTDITGRITRANDYFLQVSQYSREELIGQNHRILKSGYHSQSFYNDMWDTIKKGKVWRGEIKNKAKDGSTYWVDSSIAPIFGERGEIVNYLAVRFLITDKKVAQEELQKKARALENLVEEMKVREQELEKAKMATLNVLEDLDEEKKVIEQRVIERTADIQHEKEKLHQVTKNMNGGAILLDSTGEIIFANERAYELIGITDEHRELTTILDSIFDYFKDTDIKNSFKKCISGETFRIPEAEVNGRIYELFFHCLGDVNVNGVQQSDGCFFLISDITDTKLLERSKSELVAIASHQLRTPLTAIRGNVEMLIDESYGTLNVQQHELLSDIEISSTRLIGMVNDMLDITKIEQGKLDMVYEEVNIKSIIDSICLDLSDYANRRSVTITAHLADTLLVQSDKKRVRHVFQNLIDNAIKYSKKPGTLDITAHSNGSYIELVFKDNGIGIPKNEQSRLFGRFYRASNTVNITGSGTGLGLYIVRSIVIQLGGTIRLESEENTGSTFFVSLPIKYITEKKNS